MREFAAQGGAYRFGVPLSLFHCADQVEPGFDVLNPVLNPIEAAVDARQTFFDAGHSDFDIANIFLQHAKIAADCPQMLQDEVSHWLKDPFRVIEYQYTTP
jgi:hypothetical protein